MKQKRFSLLVVTFFVIGLLIAACGSETVEVTRVVTEKETVIQTVVEKETVIETVIETVVEQQTVLQTVLETVVEKETVVETVLVEVTVEAEDPMAEGPRYGGTWRVAGQGDIRSLDPPGAESYEDWWSAGKLLYNYLYSFDHEDNFYADLAADMPDISEDGLVYTIPLREGVLFHDGTEMTAEDVKFSLEWQLWPDTYSWGKSYMNNVVGFDDVIDGTLTELEGIKVIDDYTVEITLNKPQAVFPILLSYTMNGIFPKAAALEAGEQFGREVIIGTGPFKFVEWVPGEKVVYERHEDYYREGMPYIDRVELYLNVDPAVQMLRWESGELEHVVNVPQAETARVLTDPAFDGSRRTTAATGVNRLGFHMETPPFDDIRVRQAIAHAIDKEALVKFFAGNVIPLEGHFGVGMLQYDPEFKSDYEYNPEKAKELLAEAGFPDGIKGLKMSGDPDGDGGLIQADLKEIGIEVEIVEGQWKEVRDRIRAGEIPLFMYGWSASMPDAYDYTSGWSTCLSAQEGHNDGLYCNERVDQLLDEAERLPLLDQERIAKYREIQDIIINQDVAWVALYNGKSLRLSTPYVHDDYPSAIFSGWPFMEELWMEEQ